MNIQIPGGVKGDILIPAIRGQKKLYVNGKPSQIGVEKKAFYLENFPAGTHLIEVK